MLEFDSQDPHGRRKEPTVSSCPLTTACVPCPVQINIKINTNKQMPKKFREEKYVGKYKSLKLDDPIFAS